MTKSEETANGTRRETPRAASGGHLVCAKVIKPYYLIVRILPALFVTLLGVITYAEATNVGTLVLEIPEGFKVEALRGKGGPNGVMEVSEWKAADGRMLKVLYFANQPEWDGGVMKVAKEEAIEIAGEKTKLIETEYFWGVPNRFLVVYLHQGEAIYIILGDHLAKDEFVRILKSVKFKASGPTNKHR